MNDTIGTYAILALVAFAVGYVVGRAIHKARAVVKAARKNTGRPYDAVVTSDGKVLNVVKPADIDAYFGWLYGRNNR